MNPHPDSNAPLGPAISPREALHDHPTPVAGSNDDPLPPFDPSALRGSEPPEEHGVPDLEVSTAFHHEEASHQPATVLESQDSDAKSELPWLSEDAPVEDESETEAAWDDGGSREGDADRWNAAADDEAAVVEQDDWLDGDEDISEQVAPAAEHAFVEEAGEGGEETQSAPDDAGKPADAVAEADALAHRVADRLEEIAAGLRTRGSAGLLASPPDDPLALLVTGYVLGAGQGGTDG